MRRKAVWILAAVLILGSAVRVFHLDTMFFNGDEPLHQVRISYQPPAFVLTNNSGPLFSLLTHILLPLGRLEVTARLISFLSGVLIILLTYLVGKALFSLAVGLIAALFAACSHLLVFFAQNSRTYALLTLLFLLSVYALLRAVRDGSVGRWILYAVVLALFLFSHTIALLSLPAFAFYVGLAWLDGRAKPAPGRSGPAAALLPVKFLVATAAGAGLAVLLYLPCTWMKGMFLGSLNRGLAHAADYAPLTAARIRDILQVQISPVSSAVFALTLALFAVGLATRLRSGKRQNAFLAVAVAVPWLTFVLGRPRANDIYSLYRYLQFLLPLIFILTARGIESLARGMGAAAARLKIRRSRWAERLTLIALAGLLAFGLFSNLRDYYYSDYWRQGSYRFDRDVVDFLEERADRDAVVLIDAYPAASVVVMLNPLARDMRPEDIEIAARESYIRPSGARQVMLYVLEWPYFLDYVASRNVELWAVSPKDPATDSSLRMAAEAAAGVEVADLSRTTVLRFKQNGRPVAEKMASLAEILLKAPADAILRRQRWLLAAKAFFMTRDVRDGEGCLSALQAVAVDAETESANGGSPVERFLGGLLSLSPRDLRRIFEARALDEIQQVALRVGNNMAEAGRLADAAMAYEEVLKIGPSFDDRVLDPLIALGDRFERTGDLAGALQAWANAARLAPARADLQARIARLRSGASVRR